MKCKYCWKDTYNWRPEGCGYGVDGSVPIGTRCYIDGKLLKKY